MTKRIYDPHFREVMGTLGKIRESQVYIIEELRKIMTAQASIDADVQTLAATLAATQQLTADTATQVAQIGTDVTAIQQALANGQPVSTTDLDNLAAQAGAATTAVQQADAALQAAVTSVTALVPAPAA